MSNQKMFIVFLLVFGCITMKAQGFGVQDIVVKSDPHRAGKSSHFLKVGKLEIGISNLAGGAINSFKIPKTVTSPALAVIDIMGDQAETYGRLGQSAMRDDSHSGVYNPTQGGFMEEWGRPCSIDETPKKLTVNTFKMSLWYGDGRYDFIDRTNLTGADDVYKIKGFNNGGDVDKINEGILKIKQEDEITSEFKYSGTYENFNDKFSKNVVVNADIILHHFEYRFTEDPNSIQGLSALSQFSELQGGVALNRPTNELLPVYKRHFEQVMTIPGKQNIRGNERCMNNMLVEWCMRWDENDATDFKPKYRYVSTDDGTNWFRINRDGTDFNMSVEDAPNHKPAVIISEAVSKTAPGRSLGFYRPKTALSNTERNIVGKSLNDNSTKYSVNRNTLSTMIDIGRADKKSMTQVGFVHKSKGMLNIKLLRNFNNIPNNDLYETYQADYFILYGDTPQQVIDGIKAIDKYLQVNNNVIKAKETSPTSNIVSANNKSALTVYPNPANDATDVLNVVIEDKQVTNITIFNVEGKVVYAKTNVTGSLEIPIQQMKKGVYILKTDTEAKTFVIQ